MPWAWWLAETLSDRTEVRNWASAWVGLDLLLAAGCATTAVLHRRADDRARAAAGATAAVAVLDVWFDVLTVRPGAPLLQALLSAALELTFACYCVRIAVRRPESLIEPSSGALINRALIKPTATPRPTPNIRRTEGVPVPGEHPTNRAECPIWV